MGLKKLLLDLKVVFVCPVRGLSELELRQERNWLRRSTGRAGLQTGGLASHSLLQLVSLKSRNGALSCAWCWWGSRAWPRMNALCCPDQPTWYGSGLQGAGDWCWHLLQA